METLFNAEIDSVVGTDEIGGLHVYHNTVVYKSRKCALLRCSIRNCHLHSYVTGALGKLRIFIDSEQSSIQDHYRHNEAELLKSYRLHTRKEFDDDLKENGIKPPN